VTGAHYRKDENRNYKNTKPPKGPEAKPKPRGSEAVQKSALIPDALPPTLGSGARNITWPIHNYNLRLLDLPWDPLYNELAMES